MKYLCIDKNTKTGTIIEITADAFKRWSWSLKVPSCFCNLIGKTKSEALFGPIYKATIKSFHTHKNWKILNDANAGTDKGIINLVKICNNYKLKIIFYLTASLSFTRPFEHLTHQKGLVRLIPVVANTYINHQRDQQLGGALHKVIKAFLNFFHLWLWHFQY